MKNISLVIGRKQTGKDTFYNKGKKIKFADEIKRITKNIFALVENKPDADEYFFDNPCYKEKRFTFDYSLFRDNCLNEICAIFPDKDEDTVYLKMLDMLETFIDDKDKKIIISSREFQQFIGTEVCRSIKDNIWVDLLIEKIEKSDELNIDITDARFINEVEAVLSLKDCNVNLIYFFRKKIDEHGKYISVNTGNDSHVSEYLANTIEEHIVDALNQGVAEQDVAQKIKDKLNQKFDTDCFNHLIIDYCVWLDKIDEKH